MIGGVGLKVKKDESGEVMIEASIIIGMTLIVLVAMIGLGFYLYQQSMIYSVANETAVKIAANYKYERLDKIDTYVVEPAYMEGLRKYRTYMKLSDERKAGNYVEKRSKATNFTGKAASIEELTIYRDNIGRQRVKVTIAVDNDVVFRGLMEKIGLIKKNSKLYATAYAECVDLTGYSSQVNFVNYIGNAVNKSKFGQIYNNISDSITNIKTIIEKIR